MSVVVPSTAEYEASERLWRRATLVVVEPGAPYAPLRVPYVPPVEVITPIKPDPSGLRIECDKAFNWIIVQDSVEGLITLATFDQAATYGSVVGILNKLKAMWAAAWDEGFSEGLDEGWDEGYRSGRATFEPPF